MLARQKREQQGIPEPDRSKRARVEEATAPGQLDAPPAEEQRDAEGFLVPQKVARQFRGQRVETPSHPGGVDSRAADRIRDRERERRDRGRYASTRGREEDERRGRDANEGAGDRRDRDRDPRPAYRDRDRPWEGRRPRSEWEAPTPERGRRGAGEGEWELTPARPGTGMRDARDSSESCLS